MTTGFDNIDIIPNGSNKSVGLSHLCAHFGITRQDVVVAFGDNQNDLDVFDFAGLALATENAREEVKAQADWMIGHCNDGAVLAYLEEEVTGN
ncbi:Stress response protein YhaX [Escherichia coli]|nr:Stress response protein YhaX [Escherichia coli]